MRRELAGIGARPVGLPGSYDADDAKQTDAVCVQVAGLYIPVATTSRRGDTRRSGGTNFARADDPYAFVGEVGGGTCALRAKRMTQACGRNALPGLCRVFACLSPRCTASFGPIVGNSPAVLTATGSNDKVLDGDCPMGRRYPAHGLAQGPS